MHQNCLVFGEKLKNIKGKRVIDIGSLDVNGSLRSFVEAEGSFEYIGVDIEKGAGVDIVCDIKNIISQFGKESFDIVISTELLEHVEDWRNAISNIKNVCKSDGTILITTRSYGFHYHGYPNDFWRYEIEDMKEIFSDCKIIALEKDLQSAGVFIKVKKPRDFKEKNLSQYMLYSIVANKRVKEITNKDYRTPYFIYTIAKRMLSRIMLKKKN